MLEIPVTRKCIPILYIPTDQSNNLVQHRSSKELPHKSIGKSILFADQIAILELLNLHHINRNRFINSSTSKIQYNMSSPMM